VPVEVGYSWLGLYYRAANSAFHNPFPFAARWFIIKLAKNNNFAAIFTIHLQRGTQTVNK